MIQTTFNLSATAPPPNPTALKYDPQVTTLSIYEHTTEDEVLVRQAESIYSADIIRPMSSAKSVGRARGVIQLEGRLWCCTGTGGRRVMLDEVLPGLFPDMPLNVKYSYSGEVIQYRGTTYTFTYRRMYLNYKPPATLPAALYIGDKPGMLELCSQMSVGVFDGRCRASSIDLLGRRWMIYDADLSLGIQARLLLAHRDPRQPRHHARGDPARTHAGPPVGRQTNGDRLQRHTHRHAGTADRDLPGQLLHDPQGMDQGTELHARRR